MAPPIQQDEFAIDTLPNGFLEKHPAMPRGNHFIVGSMQQEKVAADTGKVPDRLVAACFYPEALQSGKSVVYAPTNQGPEGS